MPGNTTQLSLVVPAFKSFTPIESLGARCGRAARATQNWIAAYHGRPAGRRRRQAVKQKLISRPTDIGDYRATRSNEVDGRGTAVIPRARSGSFGCCSDCDDLVPVISRKTQRRRAAVAWLIAPPEGGGKTVKCTPLKNSGESAVYCFCAPPPNFRLWGAHRAGK